MRWVLDGIALLIVGVFAVAAIVGLGIAAAAAAAATLCWEFAPALLFAAGCAVVFNVVLWAFRRARRVLS